MKEYTDPPARLQLRRTKGFNLQAVSLAFNGRPGFNCARNGPYGNPFIVGVDGMTAEHCVIHYRAQLLRLGWVHFRRTVTITEMKERLRGLNLFCFCKRSAPHCHVDTILEVANGD